MGDENGLTVLLVNDDGYTAEGINTLADYLEEIADVRIVAPRVNHSGVGERTSEHVSAERMEHNGRDIYVVDGTPVDCVNYALTELYPGEIDIVVSGINHGYNLGPDVYISGTMAAARVASRDYDVVGVAVSADTIEFSSEDFEEACLSDNLEDFIFKCNFNLAAEFTLEFLKWLDNELIMGTQSSLFKEWYYNINIPAIKKYQEPQGLALTTLGSDYTTDDYTWVNIDEKWRLVNLWTKRKLQGKPGSDQWAITRDYLSLSILSSALQIKSINEMRREIGLPEDIVTEINFNTEDYTTEKSNIIQRLQSSFSYLVPTHIEMQWVKNPIDELPKIVNRDLFWDASVDEWEATLNGPHGNPYAHRDDLVLNGMFYNRWEGTEAGKALLEEQDRFNKSRLKDIDKWAIRNGLLKISERTYLSRGMYNAEVIEWTLDWDKGLDITLNDLLAPTSDEEAEQPKGTDIQISDEKVDKSA